MTQPRTVEAWLTAFEPVVTLVSARVHGAHVDSAEVLADYDTAAVSEVLVDFVARIIESFGPTAASEIVRHWGVTVATGAEQTRAA